jgi:hypothetical protein
MAYTEKGTHLAYFTPVAGLAAGAITVLEALDIGATAGDHGEMLCVKSCKLVRVGFVAVAEAVSGTTTAPKVIFTKRPTPGSATGESVVATLTCDSGSGIGAPIVFDLTTQTNFEVGDSLEVSWTVGVGTPTGIGHWFAEFEANPANITLATGYVNGA